jgi:hypothetical protein
MAFDIGDVVRVRTTFTDPVTTNPVDPGAVIMKYQKPDDTETSFTFGVDSELIKEAVGIYYVDLVPAVGEAGTWFYRFDGTGAAQSSEESSFDVERSEF